MIQSIPCPNEMTLRRFVLGDLVAEEFDSVAAHVGGCRSCETALSSLDAHADGLLNHLRRLGTGQALNASTAVRRPMIAGTGADLGSADCVADLGSKISRSLADGPVQLGKFELLEELGVGSFGYVFRAHDTALDRVVAVKVQRANTLDSRHEGDRFHREARSAAQLEHPNIVSLYETSETEDGVCYLVTEFIEGRTLEDHLQQSSFGPRQSARLVAELADALQYAHRRGVIHRDIKPSNILVDRDQRPYIMDFGLAKRDAGEITVTVDGEVMGTPAYMSPEQARGESRDVDARSDIYSLGVVLYELITGERPFQGNRRMLLLQVLEDEPRPPRKLNDRIPRALETICLKAMSKSPARRYPTAGDMADDLRRYLRGAPIQARPIGRAVRVWHWSRSNPLAACLFVVVSLASVTGLLVLTNLSDNFVRKTALNSAQMQSDMLEEVNAFYSEIVQRVQPHNIVLTHEYTTEPGAMPLPATFTIETGRRMSCSKSGMQVRLFSDHPFPWRTDGGPRDDFERRALRYLQEHPESSFHEFAEMDERPILRYTTARRMSASCIGCHNNHPQSPKKDWKVGDVRGVLEIIRPLDRDIARTRKTLRGTFLLLGLIALLLLGLPAFLVLAAKLRRHPPELDRSGKWDRTSES